MSERSIDGLTVPERRPANIAEAGEIIRESAARGEAIYPVGGGTALDDGLPPSRPGTALNLSKLDAIVDYPARDLTVTVEAGLTMQALADVLAKEGQWLPIDVPYPDRATVGGAMATNWSGPRRYGQGTFRDYVLGISFLDDGGRLIRGGGRVVKNVAGYDLMKLMIGSFGTMAAIVQVTLKVKPKPEASHATAFRIGTAALGPTLDRLHDSKSRPCILEVEKVPGGWDIACGFEEKAETAAWQLRTLRDELGTSPAKDVREFAGETATALWQRLNHGPSRSAESTVVKLSVPPSKLATLLANAEAANGDAAIQAHAGNGIAFVTVPAELGLDATSAICGTLLREASGAGGHVRICKAPTAWKAMLPVWGRETPDRDVMRAIKTALDPNDLFNPGRFFAAARGL